MSFSDVEHFAEIISGCEAINSGNRTAPEARYAFAVLKLRAQDNPDFGAHAGQEGFLDSVKAGAKATGEFIKKLFEAIKKWFSDVFKSTKSKFVSYMKTGDDKQKEAKREKARSILIPKIEALKTAAGHVPEDVKTGGFIESADKAIDGLKGTSAEAVVTGMNGLLDAVGRVSDSFVSYCGAHMPKKQMDSHAQYDKAVKEYKAWAEKANALNTAITALLQFKVTGDTN
jgi:flavodoxin